MFSDGHPNDVFTRFWFLNNLVKLSVISDQKTGAWSFTVYFEIIEYLIDKLPIFESCLEVHHLDKIFVMLATNNNGPSEKWTTVHQTNLIFDFPRIGKRTPNNTYTKIIIGCIKSPSRVDNHAKQFISMQHCCQCIYHLPTVMSVCSFSSFLDPWHLKTDAIHSKLHPKFDIGVWH